MESFENVLGQVHSTATLERVRIVDTDFENPDGSDVVLDTDLLDEQKAEKRPLGPIALLRKGKNYIKVW